MKPQLPTMLAIESASTQCSVALQTPHQIIQQTQIALRGHGEMILAMTDQLLHDAGIGMHQLDALAYSCGPGSFTGLRIAAATAQGFAIAHEIPVIAVSSLQMLAQALADTCQCQAAIPCIDARNEMVYWGAYVRDVDGVMRAVIADQASAAHAMNIPVTQTWVGVGDGWQRYFNNIPERVKAQTHYTFTSLTANAQAMLPLALAQYQQTAFTPLADVLPNYCRNDIAQTIEQREQAYAN